MKKTVLAFFLLFVIIFNSNVYSNNFEHIYYSCKIWGYFKYFHSEIAKGPQFVDWDGALIEHLNEISSGKIDNEQYYTSVLAMLDKAGQMADPATAPPDITDEHFWDLDLSWFDDPFIERNNELKARLVEVSIKFRPQDNYYVQAMPAGNPGFENDIHYNTDSTTFPQLSIRLLALFRYWNAVNYFFPYRYVMDQDWDITLFELIPFFYHSEDLHDYALAILRLAAKINDAHGFVGSSVFNDLLGLYYFPFVFVTIGEQNIISRIFDDSITDISVGDILLEIDGIPVDDLKDLKRPYTSASNEASMHRNLNRNISRGDNVMVELKIECHSGNINSVIIPRNMFVTDFWENYYDYGDGDAWSIIEHDGHSIGYINMGILEFGQVHQMFNDLWETDGLIFDVRNYPRNSIGNIVRYLLYGGNHLMYMLTVPSIIYPGIFAWEEYIFNIYNTSLGVYDHRTVILFNAETQSHAEFTVMALEQHHRSLKIGSQTAGADGNVSYLTLPGEFYCYFSGIGFYYPDYTPTQRIGIVPDLELYPTLEGIRENRDELVEEAINYLISQNIADIEFLSAEGAGDQVSITWQSSTENNVAGWDLYRLVSNSSFPWFSLIPVKINDPLVPGHGWSHETHYYQVYDYVKPGGSYSYILKAVFFDGETEGWHTGLIWR